MKTRHILFMIIFTLLAGLIIMFSCGDDDDDDDFGGSSDDDTVDDDDDTTDDDDDDSDDDDDDDDDDQPWPGPPWFGCTQEDEPAGATIITALDHVDQYYGSGDDFRTVSNTVDFPTETNWSRVTMRVELDCPEQGGCDAWDRFANIFLTRNIGKEEEVVELWRYITPYRFTMCMLADVTPFAPMLTGQQTINSFISTWVGPDSSWSDGNGWRITVKFIFHPATKSEVPDYIINVWPFSSIEVGNPDNSISGQIGEKDINLPASISKAEMRVTVTGHGQGNYQNCAEFCHLDQVVLINGTPFSYDPWRNDCGQNPIGPDQSGTWTYPRAGWCPGAVVIPEVFDVTSALTAGSANNFVYQVWEDTDVEYVNTCRPGAGDGDNLCEGCAFNSNPDNCDYNGGNHTTPTDKISVQLFIWE